MRSEDDSALDKGGIMAAISDVSNKVPNYNRTRWIAWLKNY